MPKEIFRITSFRKLDLAKLLAIEDSCYPQPWSAGQFLQEYDNPVSRIELLWIGPRLAGYICFWLIAGEMQILNVATSPEFRRRGVAAHMIEHAFSLCQQQTLERAWLEVRAGNRAAVALYERLGFVADALRRGYYRDGEDALLMVKEFPAEAPQQAE